MSLAWTHFPGAPAPGTPLGPVDDFRDGLHAIAPGGFPLLVVRQGDRFRAFVNLCPHQFLPLDRMGGAVLSEDGARLVCSNHGAAFDAETGAPADPEGWPGCLARVPVAAAGGWLRIADDTA